MELENIEQTNATNDSLQEEDINKILTNYGYLNGDSIIENYVLFNANGKMLGFMADYFRLKVNILTQSKRRELSFFIKAVSKTNEAKADMMKSLNLFEKEYIFYTGIKSCLDLPDLRPWSAELVAGLDDSLVFADLDALHYKLRSKYNKFDMNHALEALNTLARFHASCVIYEETRSQELHRRYRITEDYPLLLQEAGYNITNSWYLQCMNGDLECVKAFSKYCTDEEVTNHICSRWTEIWSQAVLLQDNDKSRNVICHNDLWNNNLLFHYKKDNNDKLVPDDCVVVDFQAIRYREPASDVMQILCCNLEPSFRKENIELFLNHYYQKFDTILSSFAIDIEKILPKDEFKKSAEKQTLWGLVSWACLMPVSSLDDNITKEIFSDSAQFDDILTKNKSTFIMKMMKENKEYKDAIMEIFDEIVEKYCLPEK